MKTLLEQIDDMLDDIDNAEAELAALKEKLNELNLLRARCEHVFTSAPDGYEGVVSTCRSCGIFESYVNTFNHMVQQAAKDK